MATSQLNGIFGLMEFDKALFEDMAVRPWTDVKRPAAAPLPVPSRQAERRGESYGTVFDK